MEKEATETVARLREAGHVAYFVGGWVRDRLIGCPASDIDIATSASCDQISSLFDHTVPVGIAFGVIIVVRAGFQFELATFRTDGEYVDGRRPVGVKDTTAQEDAARRDFTINGLFWDPDTSTVVDYVGGVNDIEKRVLRAIGDPNARFGEDRLRMMRAVRYEVKYGLEMEKATEAALRDHAKDLLPSVAMERIWQELTKMSMCPHYGTALARLWDLGMLQVITAGVGGLCCSDEPDVSRATEANEFPVGTPPVAGLLAMYPNMTRVGVVAMATHFKMSTKEKKFAQYLVELKTACGAGHMEPCDWAKLYASEYVGTALRIISVSHESHEFLEVHRKRQERLREGVERLRAHTPVVTGADLLAAGVSAGRELGMAIRKAERLSLNQQIYDKKVLLDKLLTK